MLKTFTSRQGFSLHLDTRDLDRPAKEILRNPLVAVQLQEIDRLALRRELQSLGFLPRDTRDHGKNLLSVIEVAKQELKTGGK